MTLEQIVEKHPAPWRSVTMTAQPGTPAVIQVIDAKGALVELFTILDFAIQSADRLSR